jgi:dolichyl-diphosphooligosaccharide--protein glycosyltransferase
MAISQQLKSKLNQKYISFYTLFVVFSMGVAWYIRTLSSKTVFLPDGTIRFATNDAWFHMRVAYTLLQNYPNRLFYDPWTNFPYGSFIHFGPLFDQMIVIPPMILALGHPSAEFVNYLGAYLPVVLAALSVIPVYYMGKFLGGRNAGAVGAILMAIAPGQILSRSLLGFTDNHVAEVLFSTIFMMFFMAAVITAKRDNVTFADVLSRNFMKMKKTIIFAVLAGISYASYQLAWTGAPLFAFIVCVYALVQYIINNLNRESSDYLGIVGITTFFISTLLVLPAIHPDMGLATYYYSWFTLIITIGSILTFVFLSLVEKYLVKWKFPIYYYPVAIIGIGMVALLVLSIVLPNMYNTIVTAPNVIFTVNTGGTATIAEASSIFFPTGTFTLNMVYGNFTMEGFFASIVGILVLGAQLFYKPKPEKVMLFIWSFLLLLAIYGQNRFAYYYSVVVVLLCAYLAGLLFDKTKFQDVPKAIKEQMKAKAGAPQYIKTALRMDRVLVVIVIIGGMVLPMYAQAIPYTSGGYDPSQSWMDACLWMKNNTPDPGMDFNAIYPEPATGATFNYPSTAYGVMSWWDYGHYIETLAHRMPNSNPFQSGVGGRITPTSPIIPGAASFLTADSEDSAIQQLHDIAPNETLPVSRYVMSDARMATEIFMAMPAWMNDESDYMQSYWTGSGYEYLPAMRYYHSMEARLHIFDANGMKHFRLVHETSSQPTEEVSYKKIYNLLYEGNIAEVDTGNVKIFEFVKGANLTGYCGVNQTVTLTTTIKTNQNRTFTYNQSAVGDSDGNYTFTVPYSTNERPLTGQTQFDVTATGPYVVQYDAYTMHVPVHEEEVLDGKTINVADRMIERGGNFST